MMSSPLRISAIVSLRRNVVAIVVVLAKDDLVDEVDWQIVQWRHCIRLEIDAILDERVHVWVGFAVRRQYESVLVCQVERWSVARVASRQKGETDR